jgi:hypothetical protein
MACDYGRTDHSVVGDGSFYIPMIQGLFAAWRIEAMRQARRGRCAQATVAEEEATEVDG